MEAVAHWSPIKGNLEGSTGPSNPSSIQANPAVGSANNPTDVMEPLGGGAICPPPLPPKLRYLPFVSLFLFKFWLFHYF